MSDPSPARTEAADPIEREMVPDAGRVRHRDKHVARTAAALMIPGALLLLLATAAVAAGADPAAPRLAALLPFAAFLGTVYMLLTRMVVRSAVTDDGVEIQWGLTRHHVPLGAITACEAKPVTGGPTVATGAGWALFANRGSVLLSWTESGASKSLVFPADDPTALAAQIDAARARPESTSVRVATDGGREGIEEAAAKTAGGAKAGR